jgi:predicted acetyltransferase
MTSAGEIAMRKALLEDKLPVYRMLELYQYELSDIWDQDLDPHGEYGYELDRFWRAEGCLALVATVAGRYAGFALVDRSVKVAQSGNWMDQFFVLKKYRGQGLGKKLAYHAFDARPGYWEVGQMTANAPAQAFWRRIIGEYTGGTYAEHTIGSGWWQGVVQAFTVAGSPSPPSR